MFGMSGTELIIIAVLALLLLGPKELPNAAKTLGKALREVRKAGEDLKEQFELEVMNERPVRPQPVAEAVPREPRAPLAAVPPPPAPALAPVSEPAEAPVPAPPTDGPKV